MSLESSLQRENQLLKKQLETITQIKNNSILELEHRLSKAHLLNKNQQQRIAQLQAQISELQQNNKRLQLFSRERSHALTHKNIRIAQLQQELENCVAKEAQRWKNEVQVLKTIINQQQAELSNYLQDHHNYLVELEQLQQPYRYLHSQRAILLEFNEELLAQIAKAEEAGSQLQEWALKANSELQHQNEQGNDLLGQIEYMVEQVSHS